MFIDDYIEETVLEHSLDDEILKRKVNLKTDIRVNSVNMDEFLTESYELFRLELSNYINKFENSSCVTNWKVI